MTRLTQQRSLTPFSPEALHKGNRLLPVRGKSCSQNAMPFLRSQFPTYHEFALQSIDGLYSQSNLDDAFRFEVNELNSGILLNDVIVHTLEPRVCSTRFGTNTLAKNLPNK